VADVFEVPAGFLDALFVRAAAPDAELILKEEGQSKLTYSGRQFRLTGADFVPPFVGGFANMSREGIL
jgi:hypothetical protein